MASQMATIYSDQINGVATVAGGVYYCAKNHFREKLKQYGDSAFLKFGISTPGIMSVLDPFKVGQTNAEDLMEPLEMNPLYQALVICMAHPERTHETTTGPGMDLSFMNKLEVHGLIAPTANIAKQKVLIFQGKKDETVRPGMAGKLQEFYTRLGVSAASLQVVMGEGNHNFPTDGDFGVDCSQAAVPYIARCKMDLAGQILQHTLGRSLKRTPANPAHLVRITQVEAPFSVAPYGYLYASEFCLRNPGRCDLHVALHGCKMDDDFDETFQHLYESKVRMTRILNVNEFEMKARHPRMGAFAFAQKAGYIEYAESPENRLMVYFPQTRITTHNYPGNPNGCWDWYGWTSSAYATNTGLETSWLMAQIQRVKKNPAALIEKTSAP